VAPITVASLTVSSVAWADAGAADQQLADRYSPIVVVRQQNAACLDGEPYTPVSVTSVLGRADVALRGPDGQVVKQAPTAADLAGKGEGYYLDLPGEPLNPKCDYDTWFRSLPEAQQPTLYSRVASDPAHPGVLALQYWFFYVYNDWNDRHEGDWEMVQLLFDASTAEQALSTAPTAVAFAQHEGSEVSAWDDPKLNKEGDHIVVYPGQGSHAAYYTQSHWFGKSAAAGFGCDNTAFPGVALTPTIVPIPSGSAGSAGDFAWLSFTGRWGQKAPSFNNGPTGPNTKTQWAAPVTWQEEEGRERAAALPVIAGPAADAFCELTTQGSMLFLAVLDSPWLTLLAIVVVIALIVWLVRTTRWRPAAAEPPRQTRRAGQIIAAAFASWPRRWRGLSLIGLVYLAWVAGIQFVQRLLLAPLESAPVAQVGAPRWEWLLVPAALLSVLLVLPGLAIALAAVQHLVHGEEIGTRVSAPRALVLAIRRPAGAIGFFVTYVVGVISFGALLLLPVGLWLIARWAVAGPTSVMEECGVREGFARSTRLTKGHRWRTLTLTVVLRYVAESLGPIVGAILLLATGLSFTVTNVIAGIVIAILLPISAMGMALQYYDLRQREQEQSAATANAPTLEG